MKFLLICGISGAGRSQASKFLEEIGFSCIDNVPSGLFSSIAEMLKKGEFYKNAAVSVEIRDSEGAEQTLSFISRLKNELPEYSPELLFVNCSDDVIINRYKEMKRFHPMALKGENNRDAVKRERIIMQPLLEAADNIIDTSAFSIWHLKAAIRSNYEMEGNASEFVVNISSFGFKHGIPAESDNVYDVRFIPNPYYVPELKNLSGLDDAVKSYIFANEDAAVFCSRLEEILKTTVPLYKKEGKTMLNLSFGCTGGHHRSVAIAEEMAKRLVADGFMVNVVHRDL